MFSSSSFCGHTVDVRVPGHFQLAVHGCAALNNQSMFPQWFLITRNPYQYTNLCGVCVPCCMLPSSAPAT
jgi:hypothetical protein